MNPGRDIVVIERLRQQAAALCADRRFRQALWRNCRYVESAPPAALDTRIHPNDQMLEHSLRHFGDANFAVSQYFGVALQQHNVCQQALRQAFPEDWQSRDVLDFACGYGRNLRFLTLAMPRSRVWASEIQPDAVAFVARELGVNALQSEIDPAQFRPGRHFDFIWVASLFSHLPPHLFEAWLARLAELLTRDGVLCFSVHDAWELPPGETMPSSGIAFRPQSENADLDAASYGTAVVTPDFVRAAIGRAFGPGSPIHRIQRGLAAHQDLYVVAKTPQRLANLAVRKGAWGWVDRIRLSAAGELYVAGWGASLDRGTIGQVEIRVDGAVHHCATDVPREDVRPVVGDDRCGFEFRTHVEPDREVFLEVIAAASPTEAALLYAGPLKPS